MRQDKDEFATLEAGLSVMKQKYREAMMAFHSLPQSGVSIESVRKAFWDWHYAGLDYFNAFEKSISLGSLVGADKLATWYTEKCETAANLLEVIATHFVAIRLKADDLSIQTEPLKPGSTSFAGMQRMVKDHDSAIAMKLRDHFIANHLPTHGFDKEETEKSGTHQIEWRFFIVGCVFAAAAIVIAAWGFSLGNLTKDQRFILRWIFPIASAFSSGSFTGSLLTGSKRFWWSLAVAATGGFAVWLLTNLFLINE